ncbi:MAG: citrate/2-methylcitrate synthase, partial [Planctomycetes bacterium]|nr:citrate/2-methylcitrate synthase [Planctomycetota bacterium]
MHEKTPEITELILKAKAKAHEEVRTEPEPELTRPVKWPVNCTVGPGLEGAIACETKIGYVNGTKGWLIYRGYDIFDLAAHATFEEVSYLLVRGHLPTERQLEQFKAKLTMYRHVPQTQRLLMSFPIETMNTMAALRLGTYLMRHEMTYEDDEMARPDLTSAISADEDSIPMETLPMGEKHAIYE